MSRFPVARMAFARIFASLAILALPREEQGCLDSGFGFSDLLKHRAAEVKEEFERRGTTTS